MRRLISIEEVKQVANQGHKHIRIEPDTIITSAARDLASEKGIEFLSLEVENKLLESVKDLTEDILKDPDCEEIPKDVETSGKALVVPQRRKVDPNLVSLIIKGVMALVADMPLEEPDGEVDSSGARVIRGKNEGCPTSSSIASPDPQLEKVVI